MTTDLKRLGKGTLIYGLGGILNRFIGFLLLPVFTAYLTPGEYGIAAILGLLTMVATAVFSLGFSASMAPCYFAGNERPVRAATVWTAMSLLLLSAGFLGGAGLVVPRWLSQWVFQTPEHAGLVTLTLLSAACTVLYEPLSLYLRFEERAREVVVLSVVAALGSIAVTVWLVVGLRRGIEGLVAGGLVGQVLALGLYLVPAVRRLPFRIDRRIGRELLRTGLPLIPAFLFVFILQQGNKYLLQWICGLEAVGIYNVGFNLGMSMGLVVSAFQSAWLPFFMPFVHRQTEARVLFGRVLTYYALAFGFLVLLLFIGARAIVIVMAQPPFHEAYRVVGLAATSEFLRGLFLILLPGMYFAGEVPRQTLVQFGAALVAVMANLVLIPRLGLQGAGIALTIGLLAQALLLHAWNRHRRDTYLNVQYDGRRLTRFAAVFAVIASLTLIPREFSAPVECGGAVFLTSLMAALLYRLLTPRERGQIRTVFRRGLRNVPDACPESARSEPTN